MSFPEGEIYGLPKFALVTQPSKHKALMSNYIEVPDITWIWADSPPEGIDSHNGESLMFSPRYRTLPSPCTVQRLAYLL